MKKLNIITALTVVLILIVVACNKDLDLKIIEPPCTFNYSAWAPCSNNIQTREYTSNPSSGCTGMPPTQVAFQGFRAVFVMAALVSIALARWVTGGVLQTTVIGLISISCTTMMAK